jgi:TolB-like protein/predicted negative regulator of RcsB-dependent stress response
MRKGGRARSESSENPPRIAILPFANISPDTRDSYFAEGLTEELISAMSKLSGVSVISRTSVMQYKKKSKPIKNIGRELNAGTILEGSVRKEGKKVRIAIQMVDVKQDRPIWAESYDREIQDIFAIQSDIAEHVTQALKVRLLSSEKSDIEKRATENTEAYELYLKGRHYWNERSIEGNKRALAHFEKAVNLDSKYALAYAGLADCYLVYSDYGWLAPKEGYSKTHEYSLKAIEIDPRLAEPLATIGWFHTCYEWNWRTAEEKFKRAIELKPSYATAHQWYALFLSFVGRPGEAYDEIKRAEDLDPVSSVIGLNLAMILTNLGKRDAANAQCRKIVEASPDYADAHRFLGFTYYMNSKTDEALGELRKAVIISKGDSMMKAGLATLLGLVGKRDEANKILEELKTRSKISYVPSAEIAQVLLSLGRANEAFGYLEKVDADRSSRVLYIRLWPWLNEFRRDPRWISIEARMGLRTRTSVPGLEPALIDSTLEFERLESRSAFDYLVTAFVDDYMRRRLYIEQSGWRSLVQIVEACRMPLATLYGKQGRQGPAMAELIARGLIESRTFTG